MRKLQPARRRQIANSQQQRSDVCVPLWGSPLIDAAADCNDVFGATLTTDVRSGPRPLDGNADGTAACDLGAVESDELFANSFE